MYIQWVHCPVKDHPVSFFPLPALATRSVLLRQKRLVAIFVSLGRCILRCLPVGYTDRRLPPLWDRFSVSADNTVSAAQYSTAPGYRFATQDRYKRFEWRMFTAGTQK